MGYAESNKYQANLQSGCKAKSVWMHVHPRSEIGKGDRYIDAAAS